MKKSRPKLINLRDHQEMMGLMKILYGTVEVKDDQETVSAHGKPRATRSGEVVESAPDIEGLLLQEQQ